MHRADVSEVVNACDAGREGELIFRFVYEVAGCKKPMRRLWISSMEDGAIKAGFASLKDGRDYGALFASALCRAKADWLIGINATRLFSCLYGKTLNVVAKEVGLDNGYRVISNVGDVVSFKIEPVFGRHIFEKIVFAATMVENHVHNNFHSFAVCLFYQLAEFFIAT